MTHSPRFVCLLLCAAGTVAGAEALQAENLLFSPPAEFKVGYHSEQGQQTLTEFVPQAQTVEDWTEMVTVQIYHGMSVSSGGFLQNVGSRYVAACPGTTSKGIMTGKTNGYAVSMLVLSCPNNPGTGKPETTAFRVIKGSDAVYSVQHAWRSAVSDIDMAKFMRDLGTATVCDARSGDHPCPNSEPLGH